MKILYITYDGLLDPLGQSQIIPYIEGLQKKGYEFYILSFEKPHRATDYAITALQQKFSTLHITWYPLPYHKFPSLLATTYDVGKGIRTAKKIIQQQGIGIIHARSYVASLIAIKAKGKRQKFVFDMRGFWPEERVEGKLWKKGMLFHMAKKYEKAFFQAADHIVVLTKTAKEILEEQYRIKKPISVIPTCVDSVMFQLKYNDNKVYDNKVYDKLHLKNKMIIAYSGSLGTWYCFSEMLNFFKQGIKRFKNLHLLLLVNDQKKAKAALVQSTIPDTQYTLCSVPWREMPNWLSLADVTLFFIKPVFSKKGSCPTKMAESFAMGIPVVTNSGIGDCDRQIIDNGIGVIISEFTDEAYAKGICKLQSLLKQKGLKAKCRSVAEREFSLSRGVQEYAKIYQACTSED